MNVPIHLTVTRSQKGRWIAAARASGKKLTDWLTEAAEAHMQQQLARVAIPDDIEFSDLHLARDPDGHLSFDWHPVSLICRASGLPLAVLQEGPEDNVCSLLTSWYMAHRAAGGAADPVMDDLLAEVDAEDAAGQPYSHAPGRA